jgi:hypothetical protein
VSVTGAIPAVARDFVGLPDSAGCQYDSLRAKNSESPALAIVTESTDHTLAAAQQREDADFHVNLDALMHTVVLQGADHFQTSAITYVRESGIFVAAEISLEDAPVFGSIENRAPFFQFAYAIRRFPRVQFRHAPIVHVLASAHGIGEVDLPAIALVNICERRGNSAFSHDGVRFA